MQSSHALARSRTTVLLIVLLFGCKCMAGGLQLPSQAFADLGAPEFRKRENAEAELLEWGRKKPEPSMDEFFRQSYLAGDPEVRERCLNILRRLVTDEYLKEGEGYIGIALKDEILPIPGDPKPRNAIRVVEVREDTPGQRSGILLNDLIVGLEGDAWHGVEASPVFRERIKMMKPNTKAGLTILRDGELLELKITLGRRPLMADFGLNAQNIDPEAIERAAKEAYFRRWLSKKKLQK